MIDQEGLSEPSTLNSCCRCLLQKMGRGECIFQEARPVGGVENMSRLALLGYITSSCV